MCLWYSSSDFNSLQFGQSLRNIEIAQIELTGGHIGIMLIIEMAKIENTGGHIGIMLIIEIAEIE